jgi:hypothetical protein
MSFSLDFIDLLPPHLRTSNLVIDFCSAFQEIAEEWVTSIEALPDLVNPETVPIDYIKYLAALLGETLLTSDSASDEKIRKNLIWMTDWLKLKGTYKSISVISLLTDLNLTIYDLYTNDYSTFVEQDWFVGDEGENPPGLDSTYYKSPHFGMAALLDKYYPAETYSGIVYPDHLWRPGLFTNVATLIEKTRPVNTVPSYYLQISTGCSEDLAVSTNTSNNVSCRIIGTWQYSNTFFDGDGLSSPDLKYFDDTPVETFDLDTESFINNITDWKLGTGGSTYMDLSGAGPYSVFPVQATGTIDSVTIYEDRCIYEVLIPKNTILTSGANLLGLYYTAVGEELMIGVTFPDIYTGTDEILKFIITVNRTV